VEATGILSEREDCTLVAWYRSLYAPFAAAFGGAAAAWPLAAA